MKLIQVKSNGWTITHWANWMRKRFDEEVDTDELKEFLEAYSEFVPTRDKQYRLAMLDGNNIPEDERYMERIGAFAERSGMEPTALEAYLLFLTSGLEANAFERGVCGILQEVPEMTQILYLHKVNQGETQKVAATKPDGQLILPASTLFLFQAPMVM